MLQKIYEIGCVSIFSYTCMYNTYCIYYYSYYGCYNKLLSVGIALICGPIMTIGFIPLIIWWPIFIPLKILS